MKYFACITLCLLAIVFNSASSPAEEYEYKDYTVQQGDTLWDISAKEVQSSFQWPMVWKENPGIKNPDRIYPGQTIKIPAGLKAQGEKELEAVASVPKAEAPETRVEAVQEEKKEKAEDATKPKSQRIAAIKKNYIVEKGVFLLSGYISKTVPDIGKVIGSPRGGETFGSGEDVYLETTASAKVGDMFYVTRKLEKVKHPVTNEFLGYLIDTLGAVKIEEISPDGTRAKIIEAFREISIGDTLDTYSEIDLPYVLEEPRKPQVEGVIVAASHMRALSGQLDIVYIDKGKKDGLEPGDILITISPGTKTQRNGIIQIINPKDSTSSALVLNSRLEITRGHAVSGVK